jgi:hypothetical protein
MAARVVRTLAAALIAGALLCTAAVADGDPASDVLLGQNVFYPYTPAVSGALQNALDGAAATAARAHFPIKVALIASPVDLGVIPNLFGKPQQYANFLDEEISFQGEQRLLVVMPAGYGVQGMDAADRAAVASLAKPTGASTDDLARAALAAVATLARAAGHPIAAAGPVAPPRRAGGGSTTTILLAVVIAVAVASAGSMIALRRRQAAARGRAPASRA